MFIRYVADGGIIFCRTNKVAARDITEILDHYCMILGYLVNYQKFRNQSSNGASNAEKKKLQIPISNKIST